MLAAGASDPLHDELARVKDVVQGVAQQVKAQYGKHNCRARHERGMWRDAQKVLGRAEHQPPLGSGWLGPHAQKEGYLLLPEKELEGKNRYRYEFKLAFKSVCKEAGVPWVTPHVLRHTFASQLAMAGVSLYKISQWLGHSDFKTTQIYAHLQASDDDIDRL